MNINPSDMDVRQGYSPAGAYTQKPGTAAAQDTMQGSSAQTDPSQQKAAQNVTDAQESALDERSASAAAAADRATAQETAKKLGEQLSTAETGLKIKVLDDSQKTVQIEVVDEKSNKVLRKIPQDEIIKLSASIREMTGVLLDKPA